MQDLADIIGYAAARGCKVIEAGDQEQLTAVEGGGGMMLLARHLGHVQLAEAVRFQAGWEQQASLRLRAGDYWRLSGGVPRAADASVTLDGRRFIRRRYLTPVRQCVLLNPWRLAGYQTGGRIQLSASTAIHGDQAG